jgi:hypothetical protein
METYEVIFKMHPKTGHAVLLMNTVKTSSPEGAKKLVYKMLRGEEALSTKVKFMYVRKVMQGDA